MRKPIANNSRDQISAFVRYCSSCRTCRQLSQPIPRQRGRGSKLKKNRSSARDPKLGRPGPNFWLRAGKERKRRGKFARVFTNQLKKEPQGNSTTETKRSVMVTYLRNNRAGVKIHSLQRLPEHWGDVKGERKQWRSRRKADLGLGMMTDFLYVEHAY